MSRYDAVRIASLKPKQVLALAIPQFVGTRKVAPANMTTMWRLFEVVEKYKRSKATAGSSAPAHGEDKAAMALDSGAREVGPSKAAAGKAPATIGKKRKKTKDPNAPKRGLSAFMFFSAANRDKINKANPGCSFGDVGKFLGEAWAKADKAPYQKKADADKVRYEKEKAKYDKK